MLFCAHNDIETGIKILVDNNSLEVIVCDSTNKYSNSYESAISDKVLYGFINNQLVLINIEDNTVEWLLCHRQTIEVANYDRNIANKCRLKSDNFPNNTNKLEIRKLEARLKEHGYTNAKLNDMYDIAIKYTE
jgi:hypothetical protein